MSAKEKLINNKFKRNSKILAAKSVLRRSIRLLNTKTSSTRVVPEQTKYHTKCIQIDQNKNMFSVTKTPLAKKQHLHSNKNDLKTPIKQKLVSKQPQTLPSKLYNLRKPVNRITTPSSPIVKLSTKIPKINTPLALINQTPKSNKKQLEMINKANAKTINVLAKTPKINNINQIAPSSTLKTPLKHQLHNTNTNVVNSATASYISQSLKKLTATPTRHLNNKHTNRKLFQTDIKSETKLKSNLPKFNPHARRSLNRLLREAKATSSSTAINSNLSRIPRLKGTLTSTVTTLQTNLVINKANTESDMFEQVANILNNENNIKNAETLNVEIPLNVLKILCETPNKDTLVKTIQQKRISIINGECKTPTCESTDTTETLLINNEKLDLEKETIGKVNDNIQVEEIIRIEIEAKDSSNVVEIETQQQDKEENTKDEIVNETKINKVETNEECEQNRIDEEIESQNQIEIHQNGIKISKNNKNSKEYEKKLIEMLDKQAQQKSKTNLIRTAETISPFTMQNMFKIHNKNKKTTDSSLTPITLKRLFKQKQKANVEPTTSPLSMKNLFKQHQNERKNQSETVSPFTMRNLFKQINKHQLADNNVVTPFAMKNLFKQHTTAGGKLNAENLTPVAMKNLFKQQKEPVEANVTPFSMKNLFKQHNRNVVVGRCEENLTPFAMRNLFRMKNKNLPPQAVNDGFQATTPFTMKNLFKLNNKKQIELNQNVNSILSPTVFNNMYEEKKEQQFMKNDDKENMSSTPINNRTNKLMGKKDVRMDTPVQLNYLFNEIDPVDKSINKIDSLCDLLMNKVIDGEKTFDDVQNEIKNGLNQIDSFVLLNHIVDLKENLAIAQDILTKSVHNETYDQDEPMSIQYTDDVLNENESVDDDRSVVENLMKEQVIITKQLNQLSTSQDNEAQFEEVVLSVDEIEPVVVVNESVHQENFENNIGNTAIAATSVDCNDENQTEFNKNEMDQVETVEKTLETEKKIEVVVGQANSSVNVVSQVIEANNVIEEALVINEQTSKDTPQGKKRGRKSNKLNESQVELANDDALKFVEQGLVVIDNKTNEVEEATKINTSITNIDVVNENIIETLFVPIVESNRETPQAKKRGRKPKINLETSQQSVDFERSIHGNDQTPEKQSTVGIIHVPITVTNDIVESFAVDEQNNQNEEAEAEGVVVQENEVIDNRGRKSKNNRVGENIEENIEITENKLQQQQQPEQEIEQTISNVDNRSDAKTEVMHVVTTIDNVECVNIESTAVEEVNKSQLDENNVKKSRGRKSKNNEENLNKSLQKQQEDEIVNQELNDNAIVKENTIDVVINNKTPSVEEEISSGNQDAVIEMSEMKKKRGRKAKNNKDDGIKQQESETVEQPASSIGVQTSVDTPTTTTQAIENLNIEEDVQEVKITRGRKGKVNKNEENIEIPEVVVTEAIQEQKQHDEVKEHEVKKTRGRKAKVINNQAQIKAVETVEPIAVAQIIQPESVKDVEATAAEEIRVESPVVKKIRGRKAKKETEEHGGAQINSQETPVIETEVKKTRGRKAITSKKLEQHQVEAIIEATPQPIMEPIISQVLKEMAIEIPSQTESSKQRGVRSKKQQMATNDEVNEEIVVVENKKRGGRPKKAAPVDEQSKDTQTVINTNKNRLNQLLEINNIETQEDEIKPRTNRKVKFEGLLNNTTQEIVEEIPKKRGRKATKTEETPQEVAQPKGRYAKAKKATELAEQEDEKEEEEQQEQITKTTKRTNKKTENVEEKDTKKSKQKASKNTKTNKTPEIEVEEPEEEVVVSETKTTRQRGNKRKNSADEVKEDEIVNEETSSNKKATNSRGQNKKLKS